MRRTLSQVKTGETVTVTGIRGDGPVKRRILDLGVTRHTEIFVRKVAPLGDPMECLVRGYELTIRRLDAQCIEVE